MGPTWTPHCSLHPVTQQHCTPDTHGKANGGSKVQHVCFCSSIKKLSSEGATQWFDQSFYSIHHREHQDVSFSFVAAYTVTSSTSTVLMRCCSHTHTQNLEGMHVMSQANKAGEFSMRTRGGNRWVLGAPKLADQQKRHEPTGSKPKQHEAV